MNAPSKVPYHVMALQIENLYAREFPEGDEKAIADHCEYIAKFINSCGWNETEYFERWMKEQDGEDN